MALPFRADRRPNRLIITVGSSHLPATLFVMATAIVCLFLPWLVGVSFWDAQGSLRYGSLIFLAVPAATLLCAGWKLMLRTEIVLDSRGVTFRQGPLPLWTETRVGRQELQGFDLVKNVRHGETGRYVSYSLQAQRQGAEPLTGVSDLSKDAGLQLIEQLRGAKAELIDV